MTEAFYAILIIAFASLSVITLFNHLVRGNKIRLQLQDLSFESFILDEERVALEAQGKCMIDLEESHRQKQMKDDGRR